MNARKDRLFFTFYRFGPKNMDFQPPLRFSNYASATEATGYSSILNNGYLTRRKVHQIWSGLQRTAPC
jgi:hypothetical protein